MWGIAGVFLGAAKGCTAAQPPFSHPHIPAARGNERRNRARKLARLEALPRPIFASLFLPYPVIGCYYYGLWAMGYGYGLWAMAAAMGPRAMGDGGGGVVGG